MDGVDGTCMVCGLERPDGRRCRSCISGKIRMLGYKSSNSRDGTGLSPCALEMLDVWMQWKSEPREVRHQNAALRISSWRASSPRACLPLHPGSNVRSPTAIVTLTLCPPACIFPYCLLDISPPRITWDSGSGPIRARPSSATFVPSEAPPLQTPPPRDAKCSTSTT